MPPVLRILQVEDNAADADLTREMFSGGSLKIEILLVTNGQDALEFLRKQGVHASAPTPELVLLDLNLPKKNGRDVLAEIKRDANLKQVPVVIFSSSDAEKDIVDSYALGANSYISKPATIRAFQGVVKEIEDFWFATAKLPSPGLYGEPLGRQHEVPASGEIVILLVEDNNADADLIGEYLDASDTSAYRIVRATRLSEAIEKIETVKPHIILLDLSLPDGNGSENIGRLTPFSGAAPIVVLTGDPDAASAYRCMDAGAEDYLPKSRMEPDSLERTIRYAIARRRDLCEHLRHHRHLEFCLTKALSYKVHSDLRLLPPNSGQ